MNEDEATCAILNVWCINGSGQTGKARVAMDARRQSRKVSSSPVSPIINQCTRCSQQFQCLPPQTVMVSPSQSWISSCIKEATASLPHTPSGRPKASRSRFENHFMLI